ncbi:hypothetical protein HK102_007581, partial [Quaeritorhiza haematococci]
MAKQQPSPDTVTESNIDRLEESGFDDGIGRDQLLGEVERVLQEIIGLGKRRTIEGSARDRDRRESVLFAPAVSPAVNGIYAGPGSNGQAGPRSLLGVVGELENLKRMHAESVALADSQSKEIAFLKLALSRAARKDSPKSTKSASDTENDESRKSSTPTTPTNKTRLTRPQKSTPTPTRDRSDVSDGTITDGEDDETTNMTLEESTYEDCREFSSEVSEVVQGGRDIDEMTDAMDDEDDDDLLSFHSVAENWGSVRSQIVPVQLQVTRVEGHAMENKESRSLTGSGTTSLISTTRLQVGGSLRRRPGLRDEDMRSASFRHSFAAFSNQVIPTPTSSSLSIRPSNKKKRMSVVDMFPSDGAPTPTITTTTEYEELKKKLEKETLRREEAEKRVNETQEKMKVMEGKAREWERRVEEVVWNARLEGISSKRNSGVGGSDVRKGLVDGDGKGGVGSGGGDADGEIRRLKEELERVNRIVESLKGQKPQVDVVLESGQDATPE